jgi:acyl carrier protein
MNRDHIFDVVRRHVVTIVENVDPATVTEDDSMRDLGADSLQIVEVVSRSMKELRLKVPRTELSRARNLSDLVDLLEKAASSREP